MSAPHWLRPLLVTAAAISALLVPATSASAHDSCPLPSFGPGPQYHPQIDRRSLGPNVTNPWFPLPIGRTWVYQGMKDHKPVVDVVTATAATRWIDGVRTRVVADRLFQEGRLEERTSDYYAQDACGNVWYFGEDTAVLDRNGRVVDRSGSFLAGANHAQPGVFMQADPQIGRRFRQEWSPGEAEDTYKALSRDAVGEVPFGRFFHALRTEETTALETGVVDNKIYVSGTGEVEEVTVRGGSEKLVLVDVLN